MRFLKAKFGCRVISSNTEHDWSPSGTYLTCLDFCFWPQAQEEVVCQGPQTLSQLKSIVEDFVRSISEEQFRWMARHSRRRTDLCCSERGGHSNHLL